jgi:hypothetical protein
MGCHFHPVVLPMALACAACGVHVVDDPANPPQRGAWQAQTEVLSITVNNQSISRATFAQTSEGQSMLPQMERTLSRACAEPSLHSAEGVSGQMNDGFGDCEAAPESQPGALVLHCRANGRPAILRLNGYLDSASGEVQLSAEIDNSAAARSNAEPTRIGIRAVQRFQRTGDCA